MNKSIRDRLVAKLSTTEPGKCWVWSGATGGGYHRYGVIGTGAGSRRLVSTHRVAWELEHGPIPDGMMVLHDCPGGDNPLCCNPAHLRLGTHAENMSDMVAKDRQARGYAIAVNRRTTRLDPEKVREIRSALRGGASSQREIADLFGVSQQTISLIGSGRTWRHVA